jgi:hypothetical protein
LRATLDLVLQQRGEKLDVRELLFDGLLVSDLEGLEHPGKAQGAQHRT